MSEQFLHGVEVVDVDDGPRPIQTVASAIIGIIGTAPDSAGATQATLALGNPGANSGLTYTAKDEGVLGNKVSVRYVKPGGNNAALSVAVAAQAITVNLATSNAGAITSTAAQVRSAIIAASGANALVKVANTGGGGGVATAAVASGAVTGFTVTNGGSGYDTPPAITITGAGTGAAAHAVLTDGIITGITLDAPGTGYTSAPIVTIAAPGSTGAGVVSATPTSYLTGGEDEAFPLDTPTLVAGSRLKAAKLGASGTLPDALDSIFDQCGAVVVVVRVDEGGTDAETLANIIGGVDSGTGQYLGVQAFLGAESLVSVRPRILLAPGFTHTRANGLANPVVAELAGIADRLRAVIFADGPSTTDEAAFAYAGDWGTKRIYMVDPRVVKTGSDGVPEYAWSSPIAAGLQAKSDNERGFWWSLSNQEINGAIGTERNIDFVMGDTASRANLLNAANIATIIRQNGLRLWGNRTLSADPKWAFLSVVRTADIINDSLQRAHLWAVDRNITKTYIQEVTDGVNDYLRHLKAIGAILGGTCWADPDLNTADQIAQGHVYFDFDFTAPTPAEHITFRSHLVNDYITEIFATN